MIGVGTFPVIAPMTYKHPRRNLVMETLVRDAVSINGFSVMLHLPISVAADI